MSEPIKTKTCSKCKQIVLPDGSLFIELTKGYRAIVDEDKYEWLNQWKWHVQMNAEGYKYAVRFVQSHTLVVMHRIIVNAPIDKKVDHKNHNTLDDRLINLRICTIAQNNFNRKPQIGASSQFKGVYWCKNIKKWRARIKINYKLISLGCFDNEAKAAFAYDTKAKQLFGEFAYLNFPQ